MKKVCITMIDGKSTGWVPYRGCWVGFLAVVDQSQVKTVEWKEKCKAVTPADAVLVCLMKKGKEGK